MSIRKCITHLLVLGCWCLPAFANLPVVLGNSSGEAAYTGSLGITVTTTYSVCGPTVPASSCWQVVAGAPSLKAISTAADGDKWGINTSGVLVYEAAGATTWTTLTGHSPTQVNGTGNGAAYILSSSGSIWYTANGGSTWAEVLNPYPTTFRQIAVAANGDQDVWALGEAVGCGYRVYRYDQTNKVWDSTTQVLTDISVGTPQDVWGVCAGQSGANAYHFDGSTWTLDTGIGAAQIVVTGDGVLFASGGTDFWYRQESSTDQFMTQLVGGQSSFSGTYENGIYGLFNNVLEKFQAHTYTITHEVAGSASGGSVSGSMSLQIKNHAMQVYNLNVAAGLSVDQNIFEAMTPLEAAACDAEGDGCPSFTASVSLGCDCDPIISDPFLAYNLLDLKINKETAHTQLVQNGPNTNCWEGKTVSVCDKPTKIWCTPSTTPPDYSGPNGMRDMATPIDVTAWIALAECARVQGPILGVNGPWLCAPIPWPLPLGFNGVTPGQYRCTYNP